MLQAEDRAACRRRSSLAHSSAPGVIDRCASIAYHSSLPLISPYLSSFRVHHKRPSPLLLALRRVLACFLAREEKGAVRERKSRESDLNSSATQLGSSPLHIVSGSCPLARHHCFGGPFRISAGTSRIPLGCLSCVLSSSSLRHFPSPLPPSPLRIPCLSTYLACIMYDMYPGETAANYHDEWPVAGVVTDPRT